MSQTKSTNLANQLARPELVNMVPYQSARRLFASGDNEQANSKTWLNANEAPGQGEYQLNSVNINRYPDFQPQSLLNAYSRYCQLPVKNILATRGADEGIELIIRSFCQAYQDDILICPPTYGMYAISAENHGAGVISVPLIDTPEKRFQLDIDSLAKQVGKVKVVFLCSPGNPSGNIIPQTQIDAVITLFKGTAMVVIDEAYIEFKSNASCAKLIAEYDNVIVLRTLSKAFALAGLRCGFTLASESVITILSKVIAPYPIAAPVAEIASQALNDDLPVMQSRVATSNRLRKQLCLWLEQQTWCKTIFPSEANFVLFRCVNDTYKKTLFSTLLENDVLIRDQSKQPQLENCLRISIGSESELSRLKTLLTEL
jgi:histidinol-phosphate aminotransferase